MSYLDTELRNIINVIEINKSEIAVVPSRWEEPFGRTALEASSYGCAVIITNVGGLPEASPKAIKIDNDYRPSLDALNSLD